MIMFRGGPGESEGEEKQLSYGYMGALHNLKQFSNFTATLLKNYSILILTFTFYLNAASAET